MNHCRAVKSWYEVTGYSSQQHLQGIPDIFRNVHLWGFVVERKCLSPRVFLEPGSSHFDEIIVALSIDFSQSGGVHNGHEWVWVIRDRMLKEAWPVRFDLLDVRAPALQLRVQLPSQAPGLDSPLVANRVFGLMTSHIRTCILLQCRSDQGNVLPVINGQWFVLSDPGR
ncbi:hypothetical protein AVEN_111423-1 [Araneus ventricosus]|uniref:Uncharacterized protein n=1 Tax=Araneus ventricosus TaxID=182803 RepID=A0A4Y2UC82_ARAVE|nr:hypothetical protein AVEN_111423-1 [Araneus ventricosus]